MKKQFEFDKETKDEDILQNFGNHRNSRIKTLIGLYKGNYFSLMLSVFFFAIKHLPVWILPIVTANIINAVTDKTDDATQVIIYSMILMGVLFAQNIVSNYFHVYLYSKSIRNVERSLRCAMVRKLQQLSISYHNRMQSGRLQSKIMRDVEQIEVLSAQIFISVLSILLNVIVAFIVVVSKSWVVFLFFLLTVPVAVIIMAKFRRKIKNYNSDFRKELEVTSALVMEMVELIPVTRAHALEDTEEKRIGAQLNDVAKKGLRLDVLQSYFSSISWVAFQIFQVLCLGFTGYMALTDRIQPGDVVMYQAYFTTIVTQVTSIITLLPTISKGLESVDSIGDVLLCMDVENNTKKESMREVHGQIDFENVTFRYEDGDREILKDLSLHVHEGETIAFVGSSGAGKTTVLNLIIGFFHPTSGRVLIDRTDLETLDLKSYRSHIAVVPQNTILFTGTLRENITYGMEGISDAFLNEVIAAANLQDVVEELPGGLDGQIMEHGTNLSGGQRQRVSIARAFVRNPDILILDEATSALDNISEMKIQQAIENLVAGRTTLIVAHRLSTIRNADRIAVLDKGELLEFGTYEELMNQKGAFYDLQQLQK